MSLVYITSHDENIADIEKRHQIKKRVRPKNYISKYHRILKEERNCYHVVNLSDIRKLVTTSTKGSHRTMGCAYNRIDPPSKYLRKNGGIQWVRQCDHTCPPVVRKPYVPRLARRNFETPSKSKVDMEICATTSDGKIAQKSGQKVEAGVETKSASKTDMKTDSKTDVKSKTKIDPKTDAKVGPKTDSKTDQKTDARIPPKTYPKTDAKSASDSKTDVKSDPKISTKTIPRTVDGKITPQMLDGEIREKTDRKTSGTKLAVCVKKDNCQSPEGSVASKKNFILSNINKIKDIKHRERIPRVVVSPRGKLENLFGTGLVPEYVFSKNFGKVPRYLEQRVKQSAILAERCKEFKTEPIKGTCVPTVTKVPGLKKISNEEREDIIKGLKQNYNMLLKAYQSLPLCTDTTSRKYRKGKLEDELRQFEQDLYIMETNQDIFVSEY